MQNAKIVFLLLGACSLLASCAGIPRPHPAHGKPSSLSQIAQTRWTADEIDGVAVGGKHHPVLTFVSRIEVSGIGACNRYQGPAAMEDGKVQIGPLAVSTMSCGEERDELEQRFLAALQRPTRLQRNLQNLYFVGPEGEAVIRFRRSYEALDHPQSGTNPIR